jgi:dipeptidyl aminopeptidase/acylaminoacyl peptidase
MVKRDVKRRIGSLQLPRDFTMFAVRFVSVSTCYCFAVIATSGSARPLTLDDLLHNESFVAAQFDPSGRYLVFSKRRPTSEQSDARYGWWTRPGMFLTDLRRRRTPPVAITPRGIGAYLVGFAPDGSSLAFNVIDPAATVLGPSPSTYNLSSGAVWTSAARLAVGEDWVRWTESGGLHFVAMPPGVPSKLADSRSQGYGTLMVPPLLSFWEGAKRNQITASPVGSGQFAPHVTSDLMLAQDESERRLATGSIVAWATSNDGTRLAVLRDTAKPGALHHRLEILDGSGTSQRFWTACAGCSIDKRELLWSDDAKSLMFVVTEPERARTKRLKIWDVDANSHRNLHLSCSLDATEQIEPEEMVRRFAWAGKIALVEIVALSPGRSSCWLRVGSDGTVQRIDTLLGDGPAHVVAVWNEAALIATGQHYWRMSRGGAKKVSPVITDQQILAFQSVDKSKLVPVAKFVLFDIPQPAGTGTVSGELISLVDGSRSRVSLTGESTKVMAIHGESGQVAYTSQADNLTELRIASSTGSVLIEKINSHLRDIDPIRTIKIKYDGEDGSELLAWLLLPNSYSSGTRIPCVVSVYPGTRNSENYGVGEYPWSDMDVSRNINLYTSEGYAVLIPSIPFPRSNKFNPLNILTPNVSAAIDEAVRQGFIDPNRLAIEGFSAGAYAAVGIVTQTNQFKAAIAQSGIYNLASAWGTFGNDWRISAEVLGVEFRRPANQIQTFFGMGGPPFTEIERYNRNSPTLFTNQIQTPLLLTHGDLDYAPISQAEELFMALKMDEKDVLFYRYWGENHQMASAGNIKHRWNAIRLWLRKYIGEQNTQLSTSAQN